MMTSCLLILLTTTAISALPNTVHVGALFDVSAEDGAQSEQLFRLAVDAVNSDRALLPQTRLAALIERMPPHDSFYASKKVCSALSRGVLAIFGPSSSTWSHVQSICDAVEVPHVETRWPSDQEPQGSFAVNLHPYHHTLSQAYVDMVRALGWSSFVVLYEDSLALVRLEEVLKLSSPRRGDDAIKVTIRQLTAGPGADYRPMLKQMKVEGHKRVVLDCHVSNTREILRQAQQVGLMTAYHNYFVTSLDLHLVELEEFSYSGANISALRLVDVRAAAEMLADNPQKEQGEERRSTILQGAISTQAALTFDAVLLFARALTDFDLSLHVEPQQIGCHRGDTWKHGNSLINYMKMISMQGLSGPVSFDSRGVRSDFTLSIVELKSDGLVDVGSWNRGMGANFSTNFTENFSDIIKTLHNQTLIVSTLLAEPYTMYKKNSEALRGNDQFEGYCIDLIDAIAKIRGFNYTIQLVADGQRGSYSRESDSWNGMIGELLSQKADLALADLTITYEREQGVDFTMPFMNLGVTILYTKPKEKDPYLFSFLSPLSLGVWLYIATAYLAVSVLLYILAKISPYERGPSLFMDSDPKNARKNESNKGSRLASRPDDPLYESLMNNRRQQQVAEHMEEYMEDNLEREQFTLINSFWFMIASILQQGTDLLPRAISTRMVAGMWWFFTLIMISSYTANLAAFLTVERMESPIESAEDLSKQHTIKYGALKDGSTSAFFRDSKIETYSRMWVHMSSDPSNFVDTNAMGVKRVIEDDGDYAYLMESTSVEYVIQRNCELTQIGGLLDSKGYGIALPPNSPYRTAISSAILQLQEGGKLHMLKEKWWKQRKGGSKCTEVKESMANELNLRNVGGVFVVLVIGMALSVLVACLERAWERVARRQRSHRRQLKRSSRSANNFSGCSISTTSNLLPRSSTMTHVENGRVRASSLGRFEQDFECQPRQYCCRASPHPRGMSVSGINDESSLSTSAVDEASPPFNPACLAHNKGLPPPPPRPQSVNTIRRQNNRVYQQQEQLCFQHFDDSTP